MRLDQNFLIQSRELFYDTEDTRWTVFVYFSGRIEMTNLEYNRFYLIGMETRNKEFDLTAESRDQFFFSVGASSPPRGLAGEAISENSITLRWCPPKYLNSNMGRYVVWYRRIPDDRRIFDQTNFCDKDVVHLEYNWNISTPWKPCTTKERACECEVCHCDDKETFEDQMSLRYLHAQSSVGGAPDAQTLCSDDHAEYGMYEEDEDDDSSNVGWDGMFSVSKGAMSLTIHNLHHLSHYLFAVRACQNVSTVSNEIESTLICGKRATVTLFTKKTNTTSIDFESIEYNDQFGMRLLWSEPLHPNGIVLRYELKYERINKASDTEKISSKFSACVPLPLWHQVYSDLVNERMKESTTYYDAANMTELPEEEIEAALHIPRLAPRGGYLFDARNIPPGNYQVFIQAITVIGEGKWSAPYTLVIEAKSEESKWLFFILLAIVVILVPLVIGMAIFIVVKNFKPISTLRFKTGLIIDNHYELDDWEIPEDDIEIEDAVLGKGHFGVVYKGVVKNLQTPAASYYKDIECVSAAVKMTKRSASHQEKREFLFEANRMKTLQSYHVVRLLGVVSRLETCDAMPKVVMELMSHGDLASYLIRIKEKELIDMLPESKILLWASQIADGMAYLSDSHVVHRDLAARNCLVNDQEVVKIADFGLTREFYYTQSYRRRRNRGTAVLGPFMWMAPEAMSRGNFSSESDVWSYGVTIWEIVNLGQRPYWNMTASEVKDFVLEGSTLIDHDEKWDSSWQNDCPQTVLNLMGQCFRFEVKKRPKFLGIVLSLAPFFDAVFQKHSFVLDDCPYFLADDRFKSVSN